MEIYKQQQQQQQKQNPMRNRNQDKYMNKSYLDYTVLCELNKLYLGTQHCM